MDSIRSSNRGRILVTKVGLDGHDRGAKVLARLLKDEGFEVIYLGVRSSPEQVADTALQQRVDVVAISLLSGAHLEVAEAVRRALDARNLQHVTIAMGGLIPEDDVEALLRLGVARAFCPGKSDNTPDHIPAALDELVAQTRHAAT
jgi:methylmalonyl-CoA mutase C-terminal domain/subunit